MSNKLKTSYIKAKSKFPAFSKKYKEEIVKHYYIEKKLLNSFSKEISYDVDKIIYENKEVICFVFVIPHNRNKTNIYYNEKIIDLTLLLERNFDPLIEMYYNNKIIDENDIKYHILLAFKEL